MGKRKDQRKKKLGQLNWDMDQLRNTDVTGLVFSKCQVAMRFMQ
jgi:hypothetical protein